MQKLQVPTTQPEVKSVCARKFIYFLFLLSGISGLIYQVVWSKMLTLLFGSTVFAVSAVTTSFFAGLALGSYYLGRYADIHGKPLRLYAFLEAGIGLTALLLPILLDLLALVFIFIYRNFHTSFYAFNLIRFVLIFGILFIPTTLMGGTLPVLTKYFVRNTSFLGREVGRLYALNTLGAVGGTLAAGFFLIETIGVRRTTYLAVLINLFVAGAILGLTRWFAAQAVPSREESPPEDGPVQVSWRFSGTSITQQGFLWYRNILLLAFGLSGFAALAYEILCLRLLIFVLPYGYNNIYVFSTILVVFLIGLTLGSTLISKFIDRLGNLMAWFCGVEVVLGLYIASTMPLLTKVVAPWTLFPDSLEVGRFVDGFLKAGLILLFPTILMGITFPLVSKLYSQGGPWLGSEVGRIYSANTLGGILGSFFAGFVFVPFLGIQKSLVVTSLFSISAGLLVYCLSSTGDRKRAIGFSTFCLIGLTGYLFYGSQHQAFGSLEDQEPILFYKEGISSTILVRQEPDGSRTLQINDFAAAGTSYYYLRNQKMMGYLPLLLHENPKRVLVIAFGTGTTVGALTLYPGLEEIDSIEIDEDVFEVARYFEDKNHRAIDHPKVRKIVDDGRNFILYADRTYDIITSEPLHPKRAGTVNLYSEDYYRLCKEKLTENGVIAQWLPFHAFQPEEFKSIIKAFKNVFPYTYLWVGEQMILIGSKKRLDIDWNRLQTKIQQPDIHEDLAEIHFNSGYAILARFIMNEEQIDPYLQGARTITDDLPYIEYSKSAEDTNLFPEILKFKQDIRPWISTVDSEGVYSEFSEVVFRKHVQQVEDILKGKALFMAYQEEQALQAFQRAWEILPEDGYLKRFLEDLKKGTLDLGL